MSLAKPDDHGGEPSADSGDNSAVPTDNEDNTEERADPEGQESASERADGAADQIASEIQSDIEANAELLRSKADAGALRRLQSTVEALDERLASFEEEYQTLQNYLMELEENRRKRVAALENHGEEIDQLSAAVFGQETSCPKCDHGRLTRGDVWLGEKIICSNDHCNFEQRLS